jgi:uncharacterized cupredoxin-like copper-binding protein
MIRTLTLAAAFGLAALPALAQATDEQKAAMIAAIKENGCVVTADNNAAVLAASGLDAGAAKEAVDALVAGGGAVANMETMELTLSSDLCQ